MDDRIIPGDGPGSSPEIALKEKRDPWENAETP
jgi:hypothetical protein